MSEIKCEVCGATRCKLWREYQTFSPRILCAVHAGADQEKDISTLDEDGRRVSDAHPAFRTDQIGWYVPCVPAEDGFWGYTSVPDSALWEWRKLPSLPANGTNCGTRPTVHDGENARNA